MQKTTSRDHAQKIIDDKIKAMGNKYCPLINDFCRHDCMCFYHGEIENVGPEESPEYAVVTPRCGNLLINAFLWVKFPEDE